MIPVVLYWSVNTEHLYSTNSCTNSWHPLGDVSVSLMEEFWHFFHVLDSSYGGRNICCTRGPCHTLSRHGLHWWQNWVWLLGQTHTLLLERPGGGEAMQAVGKPGEIWAHCGTKAIRKQIHKQSGNFVSSAVYGIVCVSLRSASDLELLSLGWHSYSNQGRQPEFTCTMTLKCTYWDLHNIGVCILPEPAKQWVQHEHLPGAFSRHLH